MTDEEIFRNLEEQDKKLDAIYKSAEKTRKYFLWTLIVSIIVIILPLVGLMFVVPQFLGTFKVLYIIC